MRAKLTGVDILTQSTENNYIGYEDSKRHLQLIMG